MSLKLSLWISILAISISSAPALAAGGDRNQEGRSRDSRGAIDNTDRGFPGDYRGWGNDQREKDWREYLQKRKKAYKEWVKASRKEQKDFEKYLREQEKDRWADQRERDRVWREFLKERRRTHKDYSRASRWELDEFQIYLRVRGYRFDDRYGNWGRYGEPRDGACFYKDSDYRGASFCLDRDEDLRYVGDRFNDRISSIRVFGRTRVTIFKDRNYSGSHRTYTDDAAHLGSFGDKISSIELR